MTMHSLRPTRAGFTLIELLVVITIILIVSVASLPVVLPTLNQRQVSTAALLVQAELSRTRDTAIRANAPRGVRLLPDGSGQFPYPGTTPAYTRLIAIEPGPDYSEGRIRAVISAPPVAGPPTLLEDLTALQFGPYRPANDADWQALLYGVGGFPAQWRMVWESKFATIVGPTTGIPQTPTSWYWNVRQGDKIVIGDTGREWTIVGPMLISPYAAQNANNPWLTPTERSMSNPERYINWGSPGRFTSTPTVNVPAPFKEFLIVLDGRDNDNDGYVDEQFDGINNDGDVYPAGHPLAGQEVIDPGFNGIDDDRDGLVDEPDEVYFSVGGAGEYEQEDLLPLISLEGESNSFSYTIKRRPVPSQGASELSLPTGTAIDMTTWNLPVPERSRLPIDPTTGYIDVMIAPNGQIVQPIAGRIAPPPPAANFYHFWITDVEDIVEPVVSPTNGSAPLLPINAPIFSDTNRVLKAERRLVSINTRTGQIVTSTAESFEVPAPTSSGGPDSGYTSANRAFYIGTPYRNAESGIKETP